MGFSDRVSQKPGPPPLLIIRTISRPPLSRLGGFRIVSNTIPQSS